MKGKGLALKVKGFLKAEKSTELYLALRGNGVVGNMFISKSEHKKFTEGFSGMKDYCTHKAEIHNQLSINLSDLRCTLVIMTDNMSA